MEHRITLVGKHPLEHQVHQLTLQFQHSAMSLSARSTHLLNTYQIPSIAPRDSDCCLHGQPFPHLTSLFVNKFVLASNLNLPWCNLRPLPHIPSLFT